MVTATVYGHHNAVDTVDGAEPCMIFLSDEVEKIDIQIYNSSTMILH